MNAIAMAIRFRIPGIYGISLFVLGLIMMFGPIAKEAWIIAKADHYFELTLEKEMNCVECHDMWAKFVGDSNLYVVSELGSTGRDSLLKEDEK